MSCCCCCSVQDGDLKVPILHSEMTTETKNSNKKGDSINDRTIMGSDQSKDKVSNDKMAEIESQILPTGKGPAIPITIIDEEKLPDMEPDIPIEIVDEESFSAASMSDAAERKASFAKNVGMSKDEIDELYYRAEFHCMDLAKDSRLCYSEFVKLLVGCGYHLGVPGAKNVWKECGKYDTSYMNVEEYIQLMRTDKELERATSGCRSVFAAFDWDCSGWASKADIIKGLETVLGITVTPELEQKINSMDSNKDGCVYYGDYLKMQLKGFK